MSSKRCYPCEFASKECNTNLQCPKRVHAAILAAPCVYCNAKPDRPCITFNGNETDTHSQRKRAGHILLLIRGEHFAKDEPRVFMRKSKGHVRWQWDRRVKSELATNDAAQSPHA